MELVLKRSYFKKGSNGSLFIKGKLLCHCIELPWKNNKRSHSCIPEGKYRLKLRYSPKFKWHFHVLGVPNRSFILFHPANNALRELRGCIAPVKRLSGPGKGLDSRVAFQQLKQQVYPALKRKEPVFLIINS
ncbi:DUF5675 family protein [Mesonia maritima]|uniref:DUF5675 domain-containing protein n=1 Tax=Mesonia maritima TaxID=1793873 RepID=A0ABU1K870_9FLAO|nr:DUF5675 family protein [Mesonia maritima]MDR6301820.1 hypothetical protein [Mesonia maritima]